MAEYTRHYDNLQERLAFIKEAEDTKAWQMLHDNFDSDWEPGSEPHGTLVFTDDILPTPEELAEAAERKAMEKAEELIDAIDNLAQAKVFLKRLCKRLFRSGALP